MKSQNDSEKFRSIYIHLKAIDKYVDFEVVVNSVETSRLESRSRATVVQLLGGESLLRYTVDRETIRPAQHAIGFSSRGKARVFEGNLGQA